MTRIFFLHLFLLSAHVVNGFVLPTSRSATAFYQTPILLRQERSVVRTSKQHHPTVLFEQLSGDGNASMLSGDEPEFEFPKPQVFLLLIQGQLITISYALDHFLKLTTALPSFTVLSKSLASSQVLTQSALLTMPLLAFAFICYLFEPRVEALREVSRTTQGAVLELLGPRFRPLLALVTSLSLGFIAGIGEELLFRYCLFSLVALLPFGGGSFWFCNVISAAVFGLGHSVTAAYAVLAAAASLYFGWVYVKYGLACACATHAIYVSLIKELECEKINKRMRAIKFQTHLCRIFILQDVLALLQCHYKVTKGTQSEGLRKALRGEK